MNFSFDISGVVTLLIVPACFFAGLYFQGKRNSEQIKELKQEIRDIKIDQKGVADSFKKDMKEMMEFIHTSFHRFNSTLHQIQGAIWMKKELKEEQ